MEGQSAQLWTQTTCRELSFMTNQLCGLGTLTCSLWATESQHKWDNGSTCLTRLLGVNSERRHVKQ
jgi:hypothetical protein